MSLLEISHLTTKFETQQGTVSAVRDVSYHLEEGEVLGIVGESGSGKIVGMIFQDPMTSLNPVFRIGFQVDEVIKLHNPEMSKEDVKKRTLEMLELVGIANKEGVYEMYPHELSGGMRQRIMIAIALSCNPELIIADEPTAGLNRDDAAVVLGLLKKAKRDEDRKRAIIVVTDNPEVADQMEHCAELE